ncbi:MAG TPA: TIGR04053 family radical SAM/SPASM domain-containing protein [Thermoanaerobaculia bacterium]|nr:TIGR04053 family radical SAM/SPASM domain-containing protein [Thermoanaerobaculia bacterium]
MGTSAARDFNMNPFVIIWEPTRACDLACLHCRAAAQPLRSKFELSTYDGYKLIDQIAELEPQVFVLTGGDPLKRPDIYEYIDYARRRGLQPSLTPSATPLLTTDSIDRMKQAGLTRLAVSLDGATAETHDFFRGVAGSFDLTLNSIRHARKIGLPVQINSTVTRRTLGDLEAMGELLTTLDIAMWSVFFLVPTGRGKSEEMISAIEVEEVFARLYRISQTAGFDVKTTEAQHYRRHVIQQRLREMNGDIGTLMEGGTIGPEVASLFASASRRRDIIGMVTDQNLRVPRGVNDAKGFVFISHIGEVYPSGFLPISGGNVRNRQLKEIYRNAPIFTSLRDTSQLRGKCGVCEFREICGGSRARAYAMTGDVLGEEPLCVYQPAGSHAHE